MDTVNKEIISVQYAAIIEHMRRNAKVLPEMCNSGEELRETDVKRAKQLQINSTNLMFV